MILKRDRTSIIIFYSALFLLCAVFSVITEDFELKIIFLISSVIMGGGLGLNIFLISEVTYEITDRQIKTHSKLLLPVTISCDDIVSAEYTSPKKNALTVTYNNGEFSLGALADLEGCIQKPEGMWSFTIYKNDINKPIEEVKFHIKNIILNNNRR